MIEYLPVSYSVPVSSPNGLAVMVTDSRMVDHWFDTHLLKKGFLICLGLFLKKFQVPEDW